MFSTIFSVSTLHSFSYITVKLYKQFITNLAPNVGPSSAKSGRTETFGASHIEILSLGELFEFEKVRDRRN